MPEFVVPECPRCGAELELRPDGTAGVCRYCDAQVVVLQDALWHLAVVPAPAGVIANVDYV